MCDVAYVLLCEQLERQVTADWQAAAFARAMQDAGDLPDLAEHVTARLAALDEALTAGPVAAGVDDEQMRLRRALGVAR